MKIYMMFLAVFMAIASAVAEKVPMINESGLVNLMETPETWRPLSEEERQAMDNPGQEVPINISPEIYKRVDFWHHVLISKYDEVVIFADGQIKTIAKNGTLDGPPKFASYIIVCFIVMGLMLISNLIIKNKNIYIFFPGGALTTFPTATLVTFAALTTSLTIFSTVISAFAACTAILAFFAACAAFFTVLVACDAKFFKYSKVYWISSLLFYALIGLTIFI